jgi:hypothetical protein
MKSSSIAVACGALAICWMAAGASPESGTRLVLEHSPVGEVSVEVLISGNGELVVPQPWAPGAGDQCRALLERLTDAEIYGRRHSFGKHSGEALQRMIDARLVREDTAGSVLEMRTIFHMMILRECQLVELARRDHERNWFGHRFERPSLVLGSGFSKKYDRDLERLRKQRGELADLFLQRIMFVAANASSPPQTTAGMDTNSAFQ